MPKDCKVKQKYESPTGSYRVSYEKHGYLYVEVENQIVVVKNPYDYTPTFVLLEKANEDWAVKR